MRHFIITLFSLSIIVSGTTVCSKSIRKNNKSASPADSALLALVGKPFPAFEFTGSRGHRFSNQSFKGKVTLVDIWELGCTPCMFSIKYFNAIHDSLQSRGFQLFSMVKDDWTECVDFLNGQRVNPKQDAAIIRKIYTLPSYEIISMAGSRQTAQNIAAARQLNSFGWPLFLVVDANGIIREVYSGFDVGNDVHAERPVKDPYSNASIQWMMKALERAKAW